MRGLLVVNPHATTTSPRVRDVLVRALGDALDLEVVTTDHRGHARALGEGARREHLDIVEALLAGDSDRSAVAMARHVDATANRALGVMFSASPQRATFRAVAEGRALPFAT